MSDSERHRLKTLSGADVQALYDSVNAPTSHLSPTMRSETVSLMGVSIKVKAGSPTIEGRRISSATSEDPFIQKLQKAVAMLLAADYLVLIGHPEHVFLEVCYYLVVNVFLLMMDLFAQFSDDGMPSHLVYRSPMRANRARHIVIKLLQSKVQETRWRKAQLARIYQLLHHKKHCSGYLTKDEKKQLSKIPGWKVRKYFEGDHGKRILVLESAFLSSLHKAVDLFISSCKTCGTLSHLFLCRC